MRQRMQMVFQDPYGSLDPRMTVRDLISEPMIVHGTPSAEIPGRLDRIMQQVGLNPRMADRYPHEFSGGQRQRIGVARALVLDPSLLDSGRASLSARRVDPGADPQHVARHPADSTNVAYLFHRARPGRCPPHQPSRGRALSRSHRRDRAARRYLRTTTPPLHGLAVCRPYRCPIPRWSVVATASSCMARSAPARPCRRAAAFIRAVSAPA